MKVDIPLTENDIDTDDPTGSGKSLFAAMAGFVALFGVIGAASWAYQRMTELAGVDGDQNIPGV
jgi:hypothetical protein